MPIDNGTMSRVATPPPVTLGGSTHAATLVQGRERHRHRLATSNADHPATEGRPGYATLDSMLKAFAHRARKYKRSLDTIERHSKLDLRNVEGKVAQIFFPTDSSALSPDDKSALQHVYNTYVKVLQLSRVNMRFVGYADQRGTEKHNLSLSKRRAEAVAAYFEPLRHDSNYRFDVDPRGESEQPQEGTNARELAGHRRVDVFAFPTLAKPPPPPPPAERVLASSKRWKWRSLQSLSVDLYAGIRLEFVDFDNNLSMIYSYAGAGPSLGSGVTWQPSDWDQFEADAPLAFLDLTGPAMHFGATAAINLGVGGDVLVLSGPALKVRGAGAVVLVSVGGSSGTLTVEHKKGKRGPYSIGVDFGSIGPTGQVKRVPAGYAGDWQAKSRFATDVDAITKRLRDYLSVF
jgi:outer membrane protein OmpA-like peptidoglycan-associated protein